MDTLIGLAAILIGLVAAFFAGGKRQKAKDETERNNLRIATKERIENADTGNPDGSDDIDWLRGRGK
tara:strand:+ start:28764 stop:28964 length:201 start_codon:yes stop_codon:yes gene_type:complete